MCDAITPDGWLGFSGSLIGIFLAYFLGDYHGNRRERKRADDLRDYRKRIFPFFLSELSTIEELFSQLRDLARNFESKEPNFYKYVEEILPSILTPMFDLLLSKPETLPDKALGEIVALYAIISKTKNYIIEQTKKRSILTRPYNEFIGNIETKLTIAIDGCISGQKLIKNS